MTTYPFLIRGPTRRLKIAHITAHSYNNALDRVLSAHPNKYIKTKHAKAMVLIEAKDAAKKESKSQKGKPVYIQSDNVTGECDITLTEKTNGKFTTQSKFLNGKEVPFEVHEDAVGSYQPPKKEVAKTIKKTGAPANAQNMAKKTNGKKVAKKPAAKSELKTVSGEKKTLTVKAVLALQKAGHRVYRQSNPTPGGILIQKRLVKYTNQEKTIAVIVVKK